MLYINHWTNSRWVHMITLTGDLQDILQIIPLTAGLPQEWTEIEMRKGTSTSEEIFPYQTINQVSNWKIHLSLNNKLICTGSFSSILILSNITSCVAYPSFETRNAGSGIEVDRLFIYPKENAGNHNTEKYELVTEQGISVLRRSANFFLAINSKSRSIDLDGKDSVNLIFEFGKYIWNLICTFRI